MVSGWGGEIWAASDGKNHGTQFHFTVPIVMPENPNLGVEEVAPKKRKATSPALHPGAKRNRSFPDLS
ncbi:hypothetical protein NON20_01170 [Synechocystis sp. B12]|nr:hypothetical protein NON20_01170 [Synechocystis sp. B12]